MRASVVCLRRMNSIYLSVIPTKLVLKIKIGSDGRIDKFKARCCVLGFRQTKGLDFNPDNVYSPMTYSHSARHR
jgi:hypothetical protein